MTEPSCDKALPEAAVLHGAAALLVILNETNSIYRCSVHAPEITGKFEAG